MENCAKTRTIERDKSIMRSTNVGKGSSFMLFLGLSLLLATGGATAEGDSAQVVVEKALAGQTLLDGSSWEIYYNYESYQPYLQNDPALAESDLQKRTTDFQESLAAVDVSEDKKAEALADHEEESAFLRENRMLRAAGVPITIRFHFMIQDGISRLDSGAKRRLFRSETGDEGWRHSMETVIRTRDGNYHTYSRMSAEEIPDKVGDWLNGIDNRPVRQVIVEENTVITSYGPLKEFVFGWQQYVPANGEYTLEGRESLPEIGDCAVIGYTRESNLGKVITKLWISEDKGYAVPKCETTLDGRPIFRLTQEQFVPIEGPENRFFPLKSTRENYSIETDYSTPDSKMVLTFDTPPRMKTIDASVFDVPVPPGCTIMDQAGMLTYKTE